MIHAYLFLLICLSLYPNSIMTDPLYDSMPCISTLLANLFLSFIFSSYETYVAVNFCTVTTMNNRTPSERLPKPFKRTLGQTPPMI